jgi:hypothetical protein
LPRRKVHIFLCVAHLEIGGRLPECSLLLPLFFFRKSLHVHFYSTLQRWFCDISQRNECLAVGSVTSGVFNVLLQASLLAHMDVLLVVLDATDCFELILVVLSKFKLVQGLAEHTLSGNFKGLAWVRKACFAHVGHRDSLLIHIFTDSLIKWAAESRSTI